MTFYKVTEPADRKLAIRTPEGGFHGYRRTLEREHLYWSAKQAEASEEGQVGAYALAQGMHQELWQVTAGMAADDIGRVLGLGRLPRIVERDRCRGLGVVAMSLLLRELLEPGMVLDDARALGRANTIVDMMGVSDGRPLDHRLHIEPAGLAGVFPDDIQDGDWYRKDSLLVRYAQPAELTEPMVDLLADQDVSVNPDELVTLYPYLGSI